VSAGDLKRSGDQSHAVVTRRGRHHLHHHIISFSRRTGVHDAVDLGGRLLVVREKHRGSGIENDVETPDPA